MIEIFDNEFNIIEVESTECYESTLILYILLMIFLKPYTL